jgi:D-arabinose 1-dehydrogenase-like Zn-dependent alcohol dehydrogenase
MRALVLDGTGFAHLQICKMPTPRPGAGQMLARVDAAGICTSLIKLVEQGPDHQLVYGWDLVRWPLILGDEGAVTLVEVGSELQQTYHPGGRYVIQPAVDHAIELLKMVKAQQIDGKAIVYPHRRTGEIKAVPAWTAADE